MIIGVPKETFAGENRVALVPNNVKALIKKGNNCLIESGAGVNAGHTDDAYEAVGAEVVDRTSIFEKSEIICQVHTAGSNTETGQADLDDAKAGQLIIGMTDPLANPHFAKTLADKGINGISLEMIPRITRAQAMDVLSSMAMLAGYKCVLLAANESPQMFPMNMTAAGTLSPTKVFVMGAGVAGLQACATAKRLGAVVTAYDIRPEAQEQILSVGAKPLVLDLEAEKGEGGYAKEQSEDFIKKQQTLMTAAIAEQDVIITTAAIPGRPSPILVTEDQVKAMKPGSVIVDLAAERGGNCALTQLNKIVVEYGVKIVGPGNIPTTLANNASQMYGKNMENFLGLIVDSEGKLSLDFEDEIVANTVISYEGDVPHVRLRSMLDLPDLVTEEAPAQGVEAEKTNVEKA